MALAIAFAWVTLIDWTSRLSRVDPGASWAFLLGEGVGSWLVSG